MPESERPKFVCGACSEPGARYVCGRCHAIDYCSRQCQRNDYGRHRRLCAPVVHREIDRRGRGLVAKKDIIIGEIIFKETAQLRFTHTEEQLRIGRELEEGLLQQDEVEEGDLQAETHFKLSREEKRRWTKLSYGGDDECDHVLMWEYPFLGTVSMNFFLTIAHMRHLCSPNASVNAVADKPFEKEVRAIKDIEAGEEVSINYLLTFIDLEKQDREPFFYLDKEDRKKSLTRWDIECNCSKCNGEDEDKIKIVREIKKMQKGFDKMEFVSFGNIPGDRMSMMAVAMSQVSLVEALRDTYLAPLLLPVECPKLIYFAFMVDLPSIKDETYWKLWDEVNSKRNVDLFQQYREKLYQMTILDKNETFDELMEIYDGNPCPERLKSITEKKQQVTEFFAEVKRNMF